MRRIVLLVLAAALAGCSPNQTSSDTATPPTTAEPSQGTVATTTSTTSAPEQTSTTQFSIPEMLDGFELGTIELDGDELQVAIADTSDKRQQGLMGVDDLLSLDGMLFVFSSDVSTGFWMKDTLIPLDIAFFSEDGMFVDGFTMEPCTENPCPVYQPGGSYRYALEMAAGDMPDAVARFDW